jgi:hypothetical protein
MIERLKLCRLTLGHPVGSLNLMRQSVLTGVLFPSGNLFGCRRHFVADAATSVAVIQNYVLMGERVPLEAVRSQRPWFSFFWRHSQRVLFSIPFMVACSTPSVPPFIPAGVLGVVWMASRAKHRQRFSLSLKLSSVVRRRSRSQACSALASASRIYVNVLPVERMPVLTVRPCSHRLGAAVGVDADWHCLKVVRSHTASMRTVIVKVAQYVSVVTQVVNGHALRDSTHVHLINPTMGAHGLSAHPERSVPTRGKPGPEPTAPRKLYSGPKSLYVPLSAQFCYRLGGHDYLITKLAERSVVVPVPDIVSTCATNNVCVVHTTQVPIATDMPSDMSGKRHAVYCLPDHPERPLLLPVAGILNSSMTRRCSKIGPDNALIRGWRRRHVVSNPPLTRSRSRMDPFCDSLVHVGPLRWDRPVPGHTSAAGTSSCCLYCTARYRQKMARFVGRLSLR